MVQKNDGDSRLDATLHLLTQLQLMHCVRPMGFMMHKHPQRAGTVHKLIGMVFQQIDHCKTVVYSRDVTTVHVVGVPVGNQLFWGIVI